MIADCHTHLKFVDGRALTSEHLNMTEMVDKCIVLCDFCDNPSDANEQIADYTTTYSSKMIGFGLVRPTEDKVHAKGINSNIIKLGLKGIVVYPCQEPFHPAHSRAMRFYQAAEELKLPVFFHFPAKLESQMVLDFCQPYLLDEIARTFKNLKIIIGTMGIPFVDQTISMIAKHPNVYADLTINPKNTWQTYNLVLAAFEGGVMDKLLFGSGFPDGSAGKCIETLLGFNKLFGNTDLPAVPLSSIRNIIERDPLSVLDINVQ